MKRMKKFQPSYQKSAYLFILSSMLILTVFVFIPLVMSLLISVLNMNIFMKNISFAGIVNFERLFADNRVCNATLNSLLFTLFEVPLQVGLALILSIYVAKNNKYTKMLRSIYYLPFYDGGDMFALDLMKFLRKEGIEAPKDYGIMGFDNIDTLEYVSQLTEHSYECPVRMCLTSYLIASNSM